MIALTIDFIFAGVFYFCVQINNVIHRDSNRWKMDRLWTEIVEAFIERNLRKEKTVSYAVWRLHSLYLVPKSIVGANIVNTMT